MQISLGTDSADDSFLRLGIIFPLELCREDPEAVSTTLCGFKWTVEIRFLGKGMSSKCLNKEFPTRMNLGRFITPIKVFVD